MYPNIPYLFAETFPTGKDISMRLSRSISGVEILSTVLPGFDARSAEQNI
jgi:hypothetical protein